jgi:hypothetical protein
VGPKDECAYSSSEIQMKAHIHLFPKDDHGEPGWGERGHMALA